MNTMFIKKSDINILYWTALFIFFVISGFFSDLRAEEKGTEITENFYVNDMILVKYKKPVAELSELASELSLRHTEATLASTGWIKAEITDGTTPEQKIEELSGHPEIELARPIYIYKTLTSTPPNDTDFNLQWALNSTNSPDSDINILDTWSITSDCSNVIVAVLDTGINYDHIDLSENMWSNDEGYHGHDFVDGDDMPMDGMNHGTPVAGVIGAVGNNSIGISGVCQKAKIMSVRVIDNEGIGTTDRIISGIQYAVNNGAKIINMSFGSFANDLTLKEAVEAQKENGILFVAAAGDYELTGISDNFYPCSFDSENILCVTATGEESTSLANYSVSYSKSADIAAPGSGILTLSAGRSEIRVMGAVDGFQESGNMESNNEMTFEFEDVSNTGLVPAFRQWGGYEKGGLIFKKTLPDQSHFRFRYNAIFTGTPYFIRYSTLITSNFEISECSQPELFTPLTGFTGAAFIRYNSEGNPIETETFCPSSNNSVDIFGKAFTKKGYILNPQQASEELVFEIANSSGESVEAYFSIARVMIEGLFEDNNSYIKLSGTSLSAAYVTGVAALLYSYNNNPNYSYKEAKNAIMESGSFRYSLTYPVLSSSILDSSSALRYIDKVQNVTVSESVSP